MTRSATDPQANPGYVDDAYLQAILELLRPVKQWSFELMHLDKGQHVLDVGCGAATDTILLAQAVGETGRVVGIDHDAEMIQKANRRAEEGGVRAWVQHDHGDASSMSYASGLFDAVHSDRVFQHVADAGQLLAEMVRVTKAGGWVVVADTDHSSVAMDYADPALKDVEWRLRRQRADRYVNGYSGRQLYRLFKQAGLEEVVVKLFAGHTTDYRAARYFGTADHNEQYALDNGAVTVQELDQWRAALEAADANGAFFVYFVVAVVAGRKP